MGYVASRAGHAAPLSGAMPENLIQTGRYRAFLAKTPADITRAQALRARCFDLPHALDADAFDRRCRHVLIEDSDTGALLGCFRIQTLTPGTLDHSYAAQFYYLEALKRYEGAMLELGRFCVPPGAGQADVLRIAWGALARLVDREDVKLLFGCASFAGVEPGRYLDAFALLRTHHLAPACWRPGVKAPQVFRFAARLRQPPDAKKAMAQMPPLLRSYLMMGGWVSDHAVVDHRMRTLHVFTGLEVAAIPGSRKRMLRALYKGALPRRPKADSPGIDKGQKEGERAD